MRQIRRRKPAEFWESHSHQWQEEDSLSLAEYCKHHGLLEIQFK